MSLSTNSVQIPTVMQSERALLNAPVVKFNHLAMFVEDIQALKCVQLIRAKNAE